VIKKDLIQVGIFGAAQGLKGEIKIIILTSTFDTFKLLNQYFIDDEYLELNFIKFSIIGKKNIGLVEGCNDRNSALLLKGKKIYSYRKNFSPIEDDHYYVVDLINCEVVNMNNEKLGKVVDIKNYGAGDLIEIINHSKKTFFIPMNKENLKNINIDKKIIIVSPILGLVE